MSILDRIFGDPYKDTAVNGNTYLIVGLGNPGKKYRDHRHNIGFMAIDALAKSYNTTLSQVKNKAIIGTIRVGEHKLVLAKPQTFMNASGDSVGPLAKFYKLEPEQVLVIYDELDLPFGTVRIREKGSAGGHNGMKSIINHVGKEFPRIRLGIGRPPGRMPVTSYVLQDFGKTEQTAVQDMLDRTVRAIETYAQENITLAMSKYNGSVL